MPSVPEPAKGGLQMVLAAFIGVKLSADLFAAVHEGRVLLVGILFLLMPTQIAAFGLPLLALGGPMLRSIDAIASAPANSGTSAAVSARPNGGTEPSSQAAATQQLRYWLYYALMWFAVRQLEPLLVWIPFMTHLQLLFVLWLQCNVLQWAVRALTLVLALVRGSRRRGDRALGEGDGADKGARHHSLYPALLSSPRSICIVVDVHMCHACVQEATPQLPFASRVPTRCTARNFLEEEVPHVDPDPEATGAVPMTLPRMPTAEAAEAQLQLQSPRQGA